MQLYIIYIVGFITIALIGWRIYHSIFAPKESKCSGCDACPLKEANCTSKHKGKKGK